jgi:hypothetical protein
MSPPVGKLLPARARRSVAPAGRAGPAGLPFLAALALAACATTVGETPRVRQVDEFRVGVTMRTDAERLLGPPQYAADEGEGRTALFWSQGPSGPQAPASATRMVKLVFGSDGRLARPAETVYPSRLGDPATRGPSLEPAGSPACTRDADCARGGYCLAGTCRR